MSGTRPLQECDILFSSALNDLKFTLGELKRSNLSISNRLGSIAQDAEFVQQVAATYQLPLIANERCGSWYIIPADKAGSAYFKSTDGHSGQWSFSLRRLNLQVLDVVGEHGGCIIVDSTRRGKSMPDALSKTVPIWICVLNRLLFPDLPEFHTLSTPPDVVSPSEHSQIESRLGTFVRDVDLLRLDFPGLRSKLCGRPIRPLWVTPGSGLSPPVGCYDDSCHLLVLCTASSSASEARHHSSGYVQGAADDSESWSCGLDPYTFWRHSAELLSISEDELPATIHTLMAASHSLGLVRTPVLVKPTNNIWIANNVAALQCFEEFDVVVSCSVVAEPVLSEALQSRYVHLVCSTGKVGSRQLRSQLPKLERLQPLLRPGARILFTCETGKDIAVGVALAAICSYIGEGGALEPSKLAISSKTRIKHRLSWIMVSVPDASPSRATLQSVNAYLMGGSVDAP